MRSRLFETYGSFKVWERPLNKGRGHRFEVREGNRVLFNSRNLIEAINDAKARDNAYWAEQRRVLKELKAKGVI